MSNRSRIKIYIYSSPFWLVSLQSFVRHICPHPSGLELRADNCHDMSAKIELTIFRHVPRNVFATVMLLPKIATRHIQLSLGGQFSFFLLFLLLSHLFISMYNVPTFCDLLKQTLFHFLFYFPVFLLFQFLWDIRFYSSISSSFHCSTLTSSAIFPCLSESIFPLRLP